VVLVVVGCFQKTVRCIEPARNVPSPDRTVCYTSRCLPWCDEFLPFYTARTGTLGWKRVLESSVAVGTSATGSQITHQQIQKVTLKITKFLPLVNKNTTTTTSATVEPNSRERNYQIIGSWTMMIQTTTITIIIIIITLIMIMPKTI
jgi:hypothetical protein